MVEKKKDEYSQLFNQVNWKAVNWARESAAAETDAYREFWTLIADGLAENIGVREIIRRFEMLGYSWKDAERLVETGVAKANGMAQIVGMRESKQNLGLKVWKRWSTANDDCVCDACKANAAQGYIEVDELFHSGHLTFPAHIGCRCAMTTKAEMP